MRGSCTLLFIIIDQLEFWNKSNTTDIILFYRVFGLPADFKEGVVFSTYTTLVLSVQKGERAVWMSSITEGRYTLGDKLQQHVVETRCSDKSLHVYWRILWKSLSLQQNFVATTSRTDSVWFDFLRLVAATKFLFWRQRYFSQKFSSTHEAICHCDMSPHLVAATHHLTCTHGVICRCDVLLQLFAQCVPTLTIEMASVFVDLFFFLTGANHQSRLQQLIDWCSGEQFNGCLILIDECLKAKHFVPVTVLQ